MFALIHPTSTRDIARKPIDPALLGKVQEVTTQLSSILDTPPKLGYEERRTELWKRFRGDAGPKIDELLALVGGDNEQISQIFAQIPKREEAIGDQVNIVDVSYFSGVELRSKPEFKIEKPNRAITPQLKNAFDLVHYSHEGESVGTHARAPHNGRVSSKDAWIIFSISAREHGFANPNRLYHYMLAEHDYYSS